MRQNMKVRAYYLSLLQVTTLKKQSDLSWAPELEPVKYDDNDQQRTSFISSTKMTAASHFFINSAKYAVI